MKFTKQFKKILSIVLVLMVGLTIGACARKSYNTKVPYGNLNLESIYAQQAGTSVKLTTKQLYNEMRINAYSLFLEEVKAMLLETQITAIDLNKTEDRDALIEYVNNAIYGTSEQEEIEKISPTDKKIKLQRYIDSMFVAGVTISSYEDKDVYGNNVLEFYRSNLAQKRFTKEIIKASVDKEFLDEEKKEKNPYYISDEMIEDEFNASYKNDTSFKVIFASFNTLAAAEQALVNAGITDITQLTEENIGEIMVKLYNEAYPYKTPLNSIDEIKAVKDEDLSHYDSSLRNFIKNLKAGDFTKTPKFLKKYTYVYKIADKVDAELADLKEDIKNEMIDDLVTSAAINTEVTKLINEAKIEIYDPLLAALFEANYEEYNRSKAFNAQLVAKINDKELSVNDFFNKLETVYAPGVVIDHFINESLLASKYMNQITNDEVKEFKKSYSETLKNFNNGALASSGFPKSMGEDLFKFAYFHATTEKEIINRYYKTQKVSELYFEDYNDDYWTALSNVSKLYHETFYSLKIKHVLLTVDYDLDGTIDNPDEFIKKLEATDAESGSNLAAEFTKAIEDIMAMVYQEAIWADSTNPSKNLEAIAEEFNRSGIIYSEKDKTDAKTWADFKKFKIGMKVEDLGTIDNSNGSNYVKPFTKAVYDLYQTITNDEELSLEKEYLPKPTDINSLCKTVFGYHLLLSAGGEEKKTAKFTYDEDSRMSSDDQHKIYQQVAVEIDGVIHHIDAYSEHDWNSIDQLKIFVYESKTDAGVKNLPSSVKSYINGFYSLFNTRYTNSTFQNYLLQKFAKLSDVTFDSSNTAMQERIQKNIEIIKNQIDSYAAFDEVQIPTVYKDWWKQF